jgi:UDP-N-acetylmuramoyl-tripeptide--D-alanyl-D-alanine ligase
MIQAILERHFGGSVIATEGNTNNHFGVPRNVFRLRPETAAAVLELGTNHPGEIATLASIVQPDIGVVTNIGKAHIEFFGSQEAIALEKGAIFRKLPPQGTVIMPVAGPGTGQLRAAAGGREVVTTGPRGSGADVAYGLDGSVATSTTATLTWAARAESLSFTWGLPGRHQVANAATAAAAATAMGIGLGEIRDGLARTTLPGMRTSAEERNGVAWCNDAYNSNPESAAAALEWFAELTAGREGARYAVLGDMLELGPDWSAGEHAQLLRTATDRLPDATVLAVGEAMMAAAGGRGAHGFRGAAEAADWLLPRLRQGDCVLLKGSRGMHLETIMDGAARALTQP